ncbi:hypothetical protein BH11VER1_BH11VER1_09490 [soil metagenome]
MQENGAALSKKAGHLAGGNAVIFVATVCDKKAAERCPIFPGVSQRLHWSFADPSSFKASWEERIAQTRVVRDDIRLHIEQWCASECTLYAV